MDAAVVIWGVVGVVTAVAAVYVMGRVRGLRSLVLVAVGSLAAQYYVTGGSVRTNLGSGGAVARVVGDTGDWIRPSFIALMLAALSEIWRSGAALREDAEGVV